MSTASAIWFTSPRQLSFIDVEIGYPGDNQLEIETLFSGISHGTEMLVYRGQIPPDMEIDPSLSTMEGSFRFPIKYGYASVGRVVDMGSRVTDFNRGDLVFAHFPHQTRYLLPQCSATKLPNDIPLQLGVFLATLETAINCTWDASPNLGEVVVISGQGVVGLLITQLLSRGTANMIIAIEPNKRRRELSLKTGASIALDPTANNIDEVVKHYTAGRGADVVIEVSGDPAALDYTIKLAAFQGRIIVASWYGTKTTALHLGNAFHRNRLEIVSSQVSNINPSLVPRWNRNRRMKLAVQLLTELSLLELISDVYPFNQAQLAYDKIDKSNHNVLQVVLQYV